MNLGEYTKGLSISVMLSGTDVYGTKCEQSVTAHDLSQQGARLDGIYQTLAPGSRVTMQTSTVDVSIGGCYVETLFPQPVGARMKVLLWLGPAKLLANGVVRASCPGVGMGIEFLDLSWEDTERLYRFLEANRSQLG